jgi:transmembrane sensor
MTGAGAAIDEAAASWAVRLDAGPLREDEQLALQSWLASSPRHHGALIRARAHWADLERLGSLAGARENDSDLEAIERIDRRKFLAAGLAASVAGALGVALFVYKAHGERFQTEVGEMRRIALTDGSTLVLNTASKALVTFGKERRLVDLIEGEALFEVAHDTQRPFIVQVQGVHVRAVGTVFAVRLRGDEVDVTVSEGAVELAHSLSDMSGGDVQRVAANEQSVVVPAKRAEVKKVEPDVLQRRLAWLDGMVAFDGEPLSVAVAEVNRHSRRKIVIDDADLKAQPIVGRFRAADAEGFCRVAAVALGATAIDTGPTIHLRPQSKD